MGPLPGAIDDAADIQDRLKRRRLTRQPVRDRFPMGIFPLPLKDRPSMVKMNVTKGHFVTFYLTFTPGWTDPQKSNHPEC